MATDKELAAKEKELLEREKNVAARENEVAGKEARATAPAVNAEPIESKHLEGLTYRDVRMKKVKDPDSGQTVEKPESFDRDLTPADILDWKDLDGSISIVSRDGKKHRIEKNPQPAKAAKK